MTECNVVYWSRNLVWNPNLVETIELEKVTDQVEQDLCSGKECHES